MKSYEWPHQLYRFQISFPPQTTQSNYTLTVGTWVEELYGQRMPQTYTSGFSIVGPAIPAMTIQVQANNFSLSWYGLQGVTYQTLCSTNLVDWLPAMGSCWGPTVRSRC